MHPLQKPVVISNVAMKTISHKGSVDSRFVSNYLLPGILLGAVVLNFSYKFLLRNASHPTFFFFFFARGNHGVIEKAEFFEAES